jgi:hypothetical protein
MLNLTTKEFSSTVWNADQSKNYESLWKIGEDAEHTVRISIKVNSHAFQSFVKAEIYSPETKSWNEIATLPFVPERYKGVSYLNEHCKENIFIYDRDKLLEKVVGILE